jgi:hypothetical protein
VRRATHTGLPCLPRCSNLIVSSRQTQSLIKRQDSPAINSLASSSVVERNISLRSCDTYNVRRGGPPAPRPALRFVAWGANSSHNPVSSARDAAAPRRLGVDLRLDCFSQGRSPVIHVRSSPMPGGTDQAAPSLNQTPPQPSVCCSAQNDRVDSILHRCLHPSDTRTVESRESLSQIRSPV